jgi:hypothetical protein
MRLHPIPMFVLTLIGACLFFWVCHVAYSDDIVGRTVDGGDYIYTASAEADSIDMSEWRARQAAVRHLANDCGVAHKNTMFGKARYTSLDANRWSTTAVAYISIEDCNQARSAKDKKALESESLAQDQERYNKILFPVPEKQDDRVNALIEALKKQGEDQRDRDEQIRAAIGAHKAVVQVVTYDGGGYGQCMREHHAMLLKDHRYAVNSPEHYGLMNEASAKLAECRRINHQNARLKN